MTRKDLPSILAVVGQTASGKSALAQILARDFSGEIVTADSRQVYRYMDIGTDKPPLAERQSVDHHMIDLVDPDASFTLAEYQGLAYDVIQDITRRQKLPILAGGTPLYVNAVLEGWSIPRVEPDMVLRAELAQEAQQTGPEALHERLRRLDPRAAAGILPSNTRRTIRALEVILRTGEPISSQQSKVAPPYNILRIGLECDRTELYRRIDARVDRMIQQGLVAEVQSLNERGYNFDLPALSGLGYRQVGQFLQGKATLQEAVQRIKWDTHAFARHQANWFRREPSTQWLDTTGRDAVEKARHLVERFLASDV